MSLLVVIKNNVVNSIFECDSSTQLEEAFKGACQANGCQPDEVDFENGYKDLPCGCSVCMTSAQDINESHFLLSNIDGDESLDNETINNPQSVFVLFGDKLAETYNINEFDINSVIEQLKDDNWLEFSVCCFGPNVRPGSVISHASGWLGQTFISKDDFLSLKDHLEGVGDDSNVHVLF